MAAITIQQALELARSYHHAGQLSAAEALCRQVLAVQPDHAPGLLRLGMVCRGLGRPTEAVVCLERARRIDAPSPDVFLHLGLAQLALGNRQEAVAAFEQLVALRPGTAMAHNNLGHALSQSARWTEAIGCFRRAVAIDLNEAQAHFNLGVALLELDRFGEAQSCFERAIALQPDHTKARGNLGSVLLERGMFAEALASYRRAVAAQPDCAASRWNLGLALLLHGQYAEGWKQHEWRLQPPVYSGKQFPQPRWDGSSAPGQGILLHAEQGYGDTIHFLRYVSLVRARAPSARLLLQCHAAMSDLVHQSVSEVDIIIGTDEKDECAGFPFDWQVPLSSLPYVLGASEPLRMAAPYLRVDPQRRALWRERLGSGSRLKIGLAWAGNPKHVRDRRRSIMEAERLLPILQVPGLECYSLQIRHADSAPRPLAEAGLIDPTERITDFADSAALVAELNLIISVDTATAHLAGALGRPVWTLLPLYPDWRWGLEREDTPWYPTMRLFRQRSAGDWEEVIQRVASELAALASQPRAAELPTVS